VATRLNDTASECELVSSASRAARITSLNCPMS